MSELCHWARSRHVALRIGHRASLKALALIPTTAGCSALPTSDIMEHLRFVLCESSARL